MKTLQSPKKRKIKEGICDKADCVYWLEIEVDIGDVRASGIIGQRHCVLCEFRKSFNFYTPWEVLDES